MQLRIARAKARQGGDEDHVRQHGADVDADAPVRTGARARRVVVHVVELADEARRALVVGRALGRHVDAPRRPLQKLRPQVLLQVLHELGHRGAGDVHRVGGAREAA